MSSKRLCLRFFDAKRCKFNMNMNWEKEDQIKVCQNMSCANGSISERKIDGKLVIVPTCDFTWNPFDNKAVTEQEFREIKDYGFY